VTPGDERGGAIRPSHIASADNPSVARARTGYPRRLRIAALVLPAVLIAALVALDYFVVERLFDSAVGHMIILAIGVAGVLAFSRAIFSQLTALQADLETRRQQLQAVNAAGLALTSELDREEVLQRVADQARAVANARYAALGVFNNDGTIDTFTTSGITPEERAKIGPLPHGRGLLGHLQREQRPLRLHDLHAHPSSVGFPAGHPPMSTFLGTPILLRGEPLGNLYLTEKEGGAEFSEADAEALETLAAQAAIAIENARLYAQAERVSAQEERQRIRMDLPAGVMQSLYGVGLLLDDAAERVTTEPEEVRTQLRRSVDRLNAAIADLRGYVRGLQPADASDRPIADALDELAERTRSARIAVSVDVRPEAAARLEGGRREAVYFIAADALGNIARHSRARRASLRLADADGALTLDIEDDGVGFDAASTTTGHGLDNMRQRASAEGGALTVTSEPGHGTRIRLSLPAREGTS
jgi:signal transduction histidine kinase